MKKTISALFITIFIYMLFSLNVAGQAIQKEQTDPMDEYNRILILVGKKDYNHALEGLKAILTKTPDFYRAYNMRWRPVVIENTAELAKAFFAGRCDILTSDLSQLAAHRAVAPNPAEYALLPIVISKEPLAPVVRHGDDQWYDIVFWTVSALIQAEELGINSNNVDIKLKSQNPRIQRFLGVIPGMGKNLGLDDK